ncbi:MAG: type I-C CRISPR-associated protein Cas5c [Streptococcaceae bacterium]|jgi:CRISPR-associated protein Cas5d|nr:type I-C CRISPR-associated protein Cas5c [Streptococcaceae bacterium]
MRNQIAFRVWGDFGLFTDPLTKIGGEKMSYQIPTYQALKGITESIYWKPTLIYYIDEVRIMNPIQTESKGVRLMNYNQSSKNDLAYYTYLRNPEYEVKVHFEFNRQRPDLKNDWDENKHYEILKRCIKAGGRRDIFLGTRECQAYVEYIKPDDYGVKEGYYDCDGELLFGMMVHGISYPDETGLDHMQVNLWEAKAENGRIRFCRPEACIKKNINEMQMKNFTLEKIESVDKLYSEIVESEVKRGGG